MSVFRASKADAGDFLNGRLAWDVLHQAASHRTQLPAHVDLTDCVMLKPYAIACLVAIGAKLPKQIALTFPNDATCAQHLVRVGLPNWFVCTPLKEETVRDTNIVVKQLQARPDKFADELVGALTGKLDLSVGVARDLASHLDEVILNALTHADSPIGAVVVGQVFPKDRVLEVAVLDLGQTIRGHLSNNPRYQAISTDSEAIRTATEEGVTGTVRLNRWNEPNSGVGLFELRKYCEAGGGELAVLSGGNYVIFSQSQGPLANSFRGSFAGSLVNIRFFAR